MKRISRRWWIAGLNLLVGAGMSASTAAAQEPPVTESRPLRMTPDVGDASLRGAPPAVGDSLADPWTGACRYPSPDPVRRTTPLFLALHPSDSTRMPGRDVLFHVAQEIAAPLRRAERQPDGRLLVLPADDTYPVEILHSHATLTLQRDGRLTDVDLSRITHPGLRAALRASVDALMALGGVGGWNDTTTVAAYPLELFLTTTVDTIRGFAPLFTLEVPIARMVSPLPGNEPPPYPERARTKWAEGTVLLTYVVNADGTVRPESIRSIPPPAPLPREMRPIFAAFERAAMESVRAYRFRPAEYLGCRVAMWVQQPFSFKLQP